MGGHGKVSKARYKQLTSGNVFGTVRILVIGRSGAGKSTLINLLMGMSDREGRSLAGKHDIEREWRHPTLPLKFHECDVDLPPPHPEEAKGGMVKRLWKHATSSAEADLKEVRRFLHASQKKSDYSERVHLVWFVVSAMDDQNATNAKVLEEIGGHEHLPVLLVSTHSDQDSDGDGYAQNVEAHLGELLSDVPSQERVMANVVKVGNDVAGNNIDDEALSALSVKTREHLDSEELKTAWAAAQQVDFQEKIRLTAREIVGYKEAAILASPVGLFPGPHQTIVGSLLTGLCRALCQTWGVPKQFKKSLKQNLASQEVYNRQFSVLLHKITELGKGAVGLGPLAGPAVRAATPAASKALSTAVATSISERLALSITPVAVAAAAVGWVYASRNDAYNSMLAMVSLGIMVSGAILYVKATYDPRGWDEDRSKHDYDKLIQEFVELHGPDLKQHVGESHQVSDVFDPEKDREQVIKYLEDYLETITSQHSQHGQQAHQEQEQDEEQEQEAE